MYGKIKKMIVNAKNEPRKAINKINKLKGK